MPQQTQSLPVVDRPSDNNAMETTIAEIKASLPRKRWTRDECHRLKEADALPTDFYELIEGEILIKMGQNEPHVFVCMQLLRVLASIFGFDFVRLPAPVALDETNEPEPDIAVTTRPARAYLAAGTPSPQDIRLVVEVSDTTLPLDRRIKAVLYARAGIAEYWIVNINARTLEVFRQPAADGYETVTSLSDTESVSPLAAPEALVRVADLLP